MCSIMFYLNGFHIIKTYKIYNLSNEFILKNIISQYEILLKSKERLNYLDIVPTFSFFFYFIYMLKKNLYL